MPSPSRIPRCKPKPTKSPCVNAKSSDSKTSNRKNLKQPTNVALLQKPTKQDGKWTDRRGITEIKRSESALLQKVKDLENEQNATKAELREKLLLSEHLSTNEKQLREQIEQLESQYSCLCLSLEENGFDPIKGTKMMLDDTEAKKQENSAKICADQMIQDLTSFDAFCGELLVQLNGLQFQQDVAVK